MRATRRPSLSEAAPRIVTLMDTHDDKRPAEGMFIGDALRRLASELGVPNARQFALRFGLNYKHLNNVWTNTRPAGMPTIVDIATKTGRAVAFFFGEEGLRPVIGTMDPAGRIAMRTPQPGQGLIQLAEACPPYFPAGARLVVDPSGHRHETWLVIRSRGTDEVWLAWAREHAGLSLLVRPTSEAVLYSEQVHEVLGAIVDVLTPPPAGPSA